MSVALAAWDRGDFAALAAAAPTLGASLDEAAARELDRRIAELKRALRRPTVEGRRVVLDALVAAAESPSGLGFAASGGGRGLIAFAVRAEGKVCVDVGRAEQARSPASAWPELAPWRKAEQDNVASASKWARAAGRVALAACALERTDSAPGDRAALMRACVAAPDDDVSRAVLADALLASGDPWGELFALQLAAAPHLLPARDLRTRQREEALIKQVAKIATPPAVAYARAVRFRRGMIDEITVSGTVFRKHGAAMLAAAPIRRLRLAPNVPSSLAALLATPALAGIHQLDLSDRSATKEDLQAIATSPHLGSLELLELGSSALLDEDDLARFRDAAWNARLFGLACRWTDAAAQALARQPEALPALSRVALGASSERLSALLLGARTIHWLDTGTCHDPLDTLLAHGRGESLAWLKCDRQPDRGQGAISELARLGDRLPALRGLVLAPSWRVDREELALIARAPAFAGLRCLALQRTLRPLDEEEAGWLSAHGALACVALSEHDLSLLSTATRERLEAIAWIGETWTTSGFSLEAMIAPGEVLARCTVAPDAPGLAGSIGDPLSPEPRPVRTRLELAAARDATPEELRGLLQGLSADEITALVANPAAPADVLAAALEPATRPPARVFNAVARHPNADDTLLRALATSKHKLTREGVTEHVGASAETLRAAFHAKTATMALVLHPNVPADVLDEIVMGADATLWRVVPKRPALSPEHRAALLAKPDAETVVTTLERAETSPAELDAALSAWPASFAVHAAAAQHPAATPAVAERIAAWVEAAGGISPLELRRVIVGLAGQPATSVERLDRLAAEHADDVHIRERLAQNPSASPALLAALAEESWQLVARNPSASAALLGAFAARGDVGLELVAANPSCPPELLEAALTHASRDVRGSAAQNASLPPERLVALAAAGDEYLRAGIAKNRALPQTLAATLAEDASPRVWLALAENPRATPELLGRVAARGGHIAAIKNALLRHPALPLPVARAL